MAGSSSEGRTSRTRSVGTKISDEEYARLEASAAASGLTVGEWRREVLLKASGQPAPLATPTEETLLSELLALRTILLNLFYDVASGEPPNRERMQSAHREGRRRRLTSASATNGNWGEQYTFDNFGNLTGKTPTAGSAPALSASYNPSTNQQAGASYDANGNPTPSNSFGGPTYTWNVENRLSQSTAITGIYQPTSYAYDPWGRRVWTEVPGVSGGPNTGEIYFYGATGQKLETYTYSWGSGGFASGLAGINIYFGGKLLQSKGVWVATDRLGSVRANSNGESMSYWPYGEERTNTANDREKFGTYMRDGVGQDYAEQRYYNSSVGAFWTPDPGGIAMASAPRPSSWNRYAYVEGDPINSTDRHGLFLCAGCEEDRDPENPCDDDPTMIGGGGGGGGGGGAPPLPGLPVGTGGGSGASIPIPAKAPPCAQNQALAGQALNNIVSAVSQVLAGAGFLQSQIAAVEGDLTANETSAGDVGFVGGHFNLILTDAQITSLNNSSQSNNSDPTVGLGTAVSNLFGNGSDGSASGVFGLFANGPRHNQSNGTSLHSQAQSNGNIDFHLDLGNPYPDLAGVFKHLGRDWLPPRMPFGSPCLDAPFKSGGSQ